ncbi:TonB-dependent receptor plug domain-containing protein, partial [Pseudoalteromonas byunsanensis]|uniref:TonB-dependent receptor plug domain-containing protein n=1 Tax=Pseudoalteromonas byunsanensis TaxID=327939 RepID=UPI0015868306
MLNSKVSKAVRLAIAFGAASTAAFSANTFAAEGEEKVERIEVTGSAIKRTDLEGALPLDVIDASAIAKSGVTSVPDLIANLPAMQGFTAAGESVGGGGGGVQTASLRNLGSEYTLVLLNGRRMVSSDSGGTIDLNSIPLSAIKRVEILKDGASALYGSDAIAGVVNFILKDDVQNTTISARYDKPKDTSSSNFSITTGFGDLSVDGFNITAAYSRDEQDNLRSVDRDFAKTGFISFEHSGQDLLAVAGSSSAIPGNAYV